MPRKVAATAAAMAVSSSAPRSQSSRRSRESTVTQRSRQDQNRPQRAKGQRESSAKPRGRFYWNITGFPFPLGPLLTRRTVRYEVSHMGEGVLGFCNRLASFRREDPPCHWKHVVELVQHLDHR